VVETGAQGSANSIPDPTPLVHAFRGNAAAAVQAVEQLDSEPNLSGGLFVNWIEPMRAIVWEYAGNRASALNTLRSWRTAMDELGFVPDFRTIGRTLVRIAREDDELLARMARAAAEALGASDGVRSVEGAALLVSGAISGDPQTVLTAVDAARAGDRSFDIAEACAEAAVVLVGSGRRDEGLEFADEAFLRYEELDARACEAVLARELREAGVRRGTRRARAESRHGWDALTETERRVVALVGEGLTNGEIGGRLFISKGTVATHLRSVFRKVGVSSRAELASEAARRLH
jgi:DNA-binding CsgD family transcriptional regulator